MTNWGNERVAVVMKREESRQNTNQSNETEKVAFIAGPSYDFWNSEGDSIYDELYGDD